MKLICKRDLYYCGFLISKKNIAYNAYNLTSKTSMYDFRLFSEDPEFKFFNDEAYFNLYKKELNDFFYTEKETRKFKLQKLNES